MQKRLQGLKSFLCGATRSVFDPNNRCKTPSIGIKNDLKT